MFATIYSISAFDYRKNNVSLISCRKSFICKIPISIACGYIIIIKNKTDLLYFFNLPDFKHIPILQNVIYNDTL